MEGWPCQVGARSLKAAVDGDRPEDHARNETAYASHRQPLQCTWAITIYRFLQGISLQTNIVMPRFALFTSKIRLNRCLLLRKSLSNINNSFISNQSTYKHVVVVLLLFLVKL